MNDIPLILKAGVRDYPLFTLVFKWIRAGNQTFKTDTESNNGPQNSSPVAVAVINEHLIYLISLVCFLLSALV